MKSVQISEERPVAWIRAALHLGYGKPVVKVQRLRAVANAAFGWHCKSEG